MPEVPPVSATLKGFEIRSWLGLAAAPGTPAAIVSQINQGVLAASKDQAFLATLANLGSEASPGSPAEMKTMVEREIERWRAVMAKAGIEQQ
ncbi:Tripartite tricarboxylate transporter family receptor [compost metagenome]